jgi:hypothetical protein
MSAPSTTPKFPIRGSALKLRTPWWVYLLTVCYLAAFSFGVYQMFMGYASGPSAGASLSDAPGGGARVEQVRPETPMDAAGVRAGDIIVVADGQRIRTDHDFEDIHWNFHPGKVFELTVLRAGQQVQLSLTFPERRVWETLDRGQWLSYAMSVALGLVYLGAGLMVLFRGWHDLGTLCGAVLLLGQPFTLGVVSNGYSALLRQMPLPVQLMTFAVSVTVGGFWLLLFAGLFPRPVFQRRWVLAVLVVPGLLMIPNNILRQYHRKFMPGHEVFPGPAWHYQAGIAIEVLYLLAGFIVLAIGYKRLQGSDRRRAGKVLLSAIVSYGAPILVLISYAIDLPEAVTRVLYGPAADVVMFLLQSVFPVTVARVAANAVITRDGNRSGQGTQAITGENTLEPRSD